MRTYTHPPTYTYTYTDGGITLRGSGDCPRKSAEMTENKK